MPDSFMRRISRRFTHAFTRRELTPSADPAAAAGKPGRAAIALSVDARAGAAAPVDRYAAATDGAGRHVASVPTPHRGTPAVVAAATGVAPPPRPDPRAAPPLPAPTQLTPTARARGLTRLTQLISAGAALSTVASAGVLFLGHVAAAGAAMAGSLGIFVLCAAIWAVRDARRSDHPLLTRVASTAVAVGLTGCAAGFFAATVLGGGVVPTILVLTSLAVSAVGLATRQVERAMRG